MASGASIDPLIPAPADISLERWACQTQVPTNTNTTLFCLFRHRSAITCEQSWHSKDWLLVKVGMTAQTPGSMRISPAKSLQPCAFAMQAAAKLMALCMTTCCIMKHKASRRILFAVFTYATTKAISDSAHSPKLIVHDFELSPPAAPLAGRTGAAPLR